MDIVVEIQVNGLLKKERKRKKEKENRSARYENAKKMIKESNGQGYY
jgi:hypothetical protein